MCVCVCDGVCVCVCDGVCADGYFSGGEGPGVSGVFLAGVLVLLSCYYRSSKVPIKSREQRLGEFFHHLASYSLWVQYILTSKSLGASQFPNTLVLYKTHTPEACQGCP